MEVRHLQAVFTAGELSPRLSARFDFDKYKTGLETLENFFVLPQGGVSRRPGLHFVAETKDSTTVSRLIPFEFSTTQAYVLEFGNLYIRFYKDNGRIESPPGTPIEVVTPYTSTQVFAVKFAQSADTLYLVHPDHLPRKLTRTSHTAWTLTTITFVDGPYLDENEDTAKLLTVSLNTVGAGRTMTASGTLTFHAGMVGSLWRLKGATTYGYVKVTAYLTSTTVTVDVLTVLDFAGTSSKWREGAWSTNGSMGTAIGFPYAIGFYEQRLVFGATAYQPQTFWGSKSADYEDFTPGTVAGDPYTYTLGVNQVNVIRWIQPARIMMLGTVGGEITVSGGTTSGITPSSILVKDETRFGSSNMQALRVANVVIFVQRNGKKVRHIQYASDKDSYTAFDVTLLAEHITGTGVFDMAYMQEPDSTILFVRNDGQCAACTYYPDQEVLGWSRYVTDGLFDSVASIPDPTITQDQGWAIVDRTINGVARRYVEYFDNMLYVDSGLTYNGTNTTMTLTPGAVSGLGVTFTASGAAFTAGDVGKDLVNLNTVTNTGGRALIQTYISTTQVTADILAVFPNTSAIAASQWGIGIPTITGLAHLNGKTVAINGDGSVYTSKVVASGSVTIDLNELPPVVVQVGLAYTPRLVTLAPEIPMVDGLSSARQRRLVQPYVRFLDTLGGVVQGDTLAFRSSADNMGASPALFTGLYHVTASGWSRAGAKITISQPQPLPMTILELGSYLEVGD